ncbi:Rieske (2Fe-2S) protein [Halorarum halobium]|uniref:Rieske (2Fe-2S) protein n=1 Tax=Halorarum halobium TaxID=3075121 RepID=UPI0028AA270A|nr:Rieske (2Fe-2S) protein [Halobaculum sp. XH14]
MSSETSHRVAAADEIDPGEGMGVEVDGIEIALFNVEGEFHAISNRCPHQRAPLCKVGEKKINGELCWSDTRGGVDAETPAISCPWHLWEIELETGEHPVSGSKIGCFDVVVEEGDVFVEL